MHFSSRYHSNELVNISQGKGDMQSPSFMGLAESMKARLSLVVLCIAQDQQRGIEKNLLGLSHRNAMMLILTLSLTRRTAAAMFTSASKPNTSTSRA
jgi:hypothetical protein